MLFTYICRLASNEKQINRKTIFLFGSFITIVIVLSLNKPDSALTLQVNTSNNFTRLIKIIYKARESLYLYLFIFLLLTLVICVFLTKKKEGAIRIKKNYESTKNKPISQHLKFFTN